MYSFFKHLLSLNLKFNVHENIEQKKRDDVMLKTEGHISEYVQECTGKGEVMAYVADVARFIILFFSKLSSHIVDTLSVVIFLFLLNSQLHLTWWLLLWFVNAINC